MNAALVKKEGENHVRIPLATLKGPNTVTPTTSSFTSYPVASTSTRITPSVRPQSTLTAGALSNVMKKLTIIEAHEAVSSKMITERPYDQMAIFSWSVFRDSSAISLAKLSVFLARKRGLYYRKSRQRWRHKSSIDNRSTTVWLIASY